MISRYYITALGLPLLIAFSSCSIFSRKVKKEAVLPADREQIQVKTTVETYTPEEIKKGVVKGDWAIEKVGEKETVGEEAPFIKFVPAEGKIYGNNGCNVINGSYSCNPADSTLSFSNLASTMRLCGKTGITDTEVSVALGETKYYSWESKDSDYYIYLLDENHQLLMTLMHQNFQFLNGSWHITAIDGTPVDVPDMKIVIDVDEGKIHGNTGCNILNGNMEIDMERPNSISFQSIATTRMACPDNINETAFIMALEEASAAKPVSTSEVILYSSDKREVLKMVRTSDKLSD